MARVTVEDCLEQVDNQYDLIILAKERTLQIGAGDKPLVDEDNDKKTVISLREIGDKKIDIKNLNNATIDRARDHPEDATVQEDFDAPEGDEFEAIYKGEVSKSGQAILPSKRSRKVPVASAAVPVVDDADEGDDSDNDNVSEDIVDQTTEENPTEDKPSE
jgi:DNA-directed RNA polymerase subunit omega